jgi:hypothetical protein
MSYASVAAAERLRAEAARTRETAATLCKLAGETVARVGSTRTLIAHEQTRRYALATRCGEALVKHCAWCGRTRAASGAWHSLAPNALWDACVIHSHGICAACRGRLLPPELDVPASAPQLAAAGARS